ncbi:hypothetical protein VL10_20785 [Leclercia adecarboxylata]|nr:hypothetical protein VL10_20785 [Leclercia adecarboxylata]KMN64114.1 hypothetical protein VK95_16490 [Leclercia sp. LK8]
MSLRNHLRLIDVHQQRLAMLRHRYPTGEVIKTESGARYLQIHLRNEQYELAQAWFDVDQWLQTMDVQLPSIPWKEVPQDYIAGWLNRHQLSFYCEESVWAAEAITVLKTEMPEYALCLPAEPCPLLCLGWPGEDRVSSLSNASALAIPFRLEVTLGHSWLSLQQLAELSEGDLLLIKTPAAFLSVGKRRIYHVTHYQNQEVRVGEPFTEHQETYREEEESLFEWSALPVEAEFVLDGLNVTLAELEAIAPGTALPVKQGAEQNMKIYLNKKLFARGELVALESGNLAVEVQHVNAGLMGEMESTDAE